MKFLLIASVLLASITSVSAMELNAYKDSSTGDVILSDSSVEAAWASTAPACLKDGSKILGVNKAFKSMTLGYRDCSNGKAALRKHKALGFKVTVIKLAELSDAKIKEVLKK